MALQSAAFPCPHCGAEVRPPPEYVAALDDRQKAQRQLNRAERVWRWSRWTSSRPLVYLARLFIVGWSLLVLFAAAAMSGTWRSTVLLLCIVLIVLFVIVGWAVTGVMRDERATLPPLPEWHALRAVAAADECRTCGAPIRFPEDHLATLCPYCGGENYRAALADAQHRQARTQKAEARASLVAAVRLLDENRAEAFTFVTLMAFAELFYAVFFGLSALWDLVTG